MQQPHWYQRALDTASQMHVTQVEGVDITYRTWGDVGKPGIVLIHGSNAHLEWWRFVAPYLADQFRVAALDLSGNGNSGWRARYSGELFAREVWAVCQAAELGERPFVVGHSFGGFVALEAAHRFGADMGGVLFMDFTVAPPGQYLEWGMRAKREDAKPRRRRRVYADQDTIMGRFRLLPDQPGVYPPVLAHMARYGIRQVEGGWTWKFDPTLFDHLEMGIDQRDKFTRLACRSAVILAEHSEDEGAYFGGYMNQIAGGALPVLTVPDTYHHLMFDDPMSTTMATKGLLLDWIREDHADEIRNNLAAVTGQDMPQQRT
ncbi:MAG: alpha/beta hydrolase [Pseudomonadales bacterium]|nr:alpha/beta hydrolase [Pseudomonadales bacterium]MDP6828681.1 alpha/beta hydrolase [Pseudomonadales bacterium]MDP6973089.1 alpha/beta hydrolase [Pseudomonadales bacterium]